MNMTELLKIMDVLGIEHQSNTPEFGAGFYIFRGEGVVIDVKNVDHDECYWDDITEPESDFMVATVFSQHDNTTGCSDIDLIDIREINTLDEAIAHVVKSVTAPDLEAMAFEEVYKDEEGSDNDSPILGCVGKSGLSAIGGGR